MSTPAITRNTSMDWWPAAPVGAPKRTPPGFALASLTSSATECTGNDGCTTRIIGALPIRLTALKSSMRYGTFLYSAGLTTTPVVLFITVPDLLQDLSAE